MSAYKAPPLGEKYGLLTVISSKKIIVNYKSLYLCKCECGVVKKAYANELRSGRVVSCGCRKRGNIGRITKKHGMTETPEYENYSEKKCIGQFILYEQVTAGFQADSKVLK